MPSKRHYGYAFSWVSCIFRYLHLSPFCPTIRLLVHYPIRSPFLHVPSTLIYAITLFALMFRMVPSLLRGYLLQICLPTYLRSLWTLFPLLAIAMFLDFLFHFLLSILDFSYYHLLPAKTRSFFPPGFNALVFCATFIHPHLFLTF